MPDRNQYTQKLLDLQVQYDKGKKVDRAILYYVGTLDAFSPHTPRICGLEQFVINGNRTWGTVEYSKGKEHSGRLPRKTKGTMEMERIAKELSRYKTGTPKFREIVASARGIIDV